MDLITWLIAALATARLTRLVTDDRITQAPRLWLLTRIDPEGLAGYLIHCTWCVSIWAGGVVAAVGALAGVWPWWWALPMALSFSYTAGWLATKEGD